MADAWTEMDAWLQRRGDELAERVAERVYSGAPFDADHYRLVGQSLAFGRMRSFIHGARKAEGNPR